MRMRKIYLDWPSLAERGLRVAEEVSPGLFEPRSIVVVGMGGSGILGDYLEALAYNKVPVYTVKSPHLPGWVGDRDLVLAVSYSGNTLETLRCVEQVLSRGSPVVVITSGGRLGRLAEERRLPLVRLVEGIPPRTALPEMLFSALRVLENTGVHIAEPRDYEEALSLMRTAASRDYGRLVEHLSTGFPIVVTCNSLRALGLRWKNELNENSKLPAKLEVYPEAGHNDIVGWELPPPGDYRFLLVEDAACSHLTSRLAEYYSAVGRVARLAVEGSSLLARLLQGSLVAGLVSVEVGVRRGVDPEETRSISWYKGVLKGILGEPGDR